MAHKISAYAYVECSAKMQQGVHDVFETAAKAALKKNSSLINLPRRCHILWRKEVSDIPYVVKYQMPCFQNEANGGSA